MKTEDTSIGKIENFQYSQANWLYTLKSTREWNEKLLELMRKFSKVVQWRTQCTKITAIARE